MPYKTLKTKKILFVEDNENITNAIKPIFEKIFKEIHLAQDGKNALEIHQENNDIDIIISDINMPHLSGFGLLEEIRKTNTTIPFIIMSAHADTHYKNKARLLKADDYIVKPIDIKKLLECISNSLKPIETKI